MPFIERGSPFRPSGQYSHPVYECGGGMGRRSGGEWPPPVIYLGVVLTGLFFYLYGMWENDRVDARWDASRYPDRPVPCGAVSTSFLRAIALMAGLAGLVLNMLLGGEFAVGALLLIVISLYNMFHKFWSGSILLMGLCRGLWVTAAGLFFPMRRAAPFFRMPCCGMLWGWPCSPA